MFKRLTNNRFYYSFILVFVLTINSISAQCPVTIATQPTDATACSGGNATFSVVVNPSVNITGYQWQVNTGSGFNDISNGGVYSNVTTTTLNITGVNSGFNGYLYRCIILSNCGSGDVVSDEKALTVTPNAWTGATSSDWNDASNWCAGVVPTSHDDVDIILDFMFTGNEPTILSGEQGYCKNLNFDDQLGGLTFNNATLNISGDLNYGSGSFFVNSSSYLIFEGTTAQHVSNGWLVVSNLILNNSNGLVVDGANITVNNNLEFRAGKIFLSNNLLIVNTISSASDTRYICTCDEMGTPSAGGGGVRKTILSGTNFTYPIGPNLTSYNPITIENTSGPNERFLVYIDHSTLPGASATEAVERTWHVAEETAGGNTATLTLEWDASHEAGSFDHSSANCRILQSDGTNLIYTGYSVQPGAATNSGGTTWTKSLTNVSSFDAWGVTSQSCTPSVTTQPSDAITCSGGNASFSVVATGAITAYQWQVNTGSGFANITNNAVYSGANTANLTLTGVNSTYDQYLYKCIIYDACGGGIATNNKILTVSANNWVGGTSNDWNTPSNWSCGVVPTNHDNVRIVTGNPTVASGTQAYCRDMSKGGFLSNLNIAGATLNISGDLNYTGGTILTNSSSVILLNGSTTQHLYGSATLAVHNLTINNSNDIISGKNITIYNTLKLNAGKLFLKDNILIANNISAISNSRYICTCDESGNAMLGGGVRKTINTGSSYTFPVGSSLNGYTPVTISNTSGPAEEFTISIDNTPLAGASDVETVGLTWYIEETTPGGNVADITLQWNESQEGGSFNRNNCGILKTDGTNVVYTGYTIQAGASTSMGGASWSKTLTGVTAFSPWGVSSQNSLLPIELLDFKAHILNKNTAQITWEITANSTPQYFEVLKSDNAKDYKSIGYVKANGDLTYIFKDENLNKGINYFKLKMVDTDGEIAFSKVVSLINTGDKTTHFTLVPNLVTDKANVIFDGLKPQNAQIHIVNTNGQLVKRVDVKTDESFSYQLDCADLLPGIYFVQIVTEGGATYSNVRLMKQ